MSVSLQIKLPKELTELKQEQEKFQKCINLITSSILQNINALGTTPFITGTLERSAKLKYQVSKFNSQIEWQALYAKRLYFGDTFNFTKLSHPNAKSRWADDVINNKNLTNKIIKVIFNKFYK